MWPTWCTNSNPTTNDHVPNNAMAERRDDAEMALARNMRRKTSVVDSHLAPTPVHLWNFKAWSQSMDPNLGPRQPKPSKMIDLGAQHPQGVSFRAAEADLRETPSMHLGAPRGAPFHSLHNTRNPRNHWHSSFHKLILTV